MRVHNRTIMACALLAAAYYGGVPGGAFGAHQLQLAAIRKKRRHDGERPATNLPAKILCWESAVEENGWNKGGGYGKRFERLFKVSYGEFEVLAARIESRREGARPPLPKPTRAGAPAKRSGRKPMVSAQLALAMTLRYMAGGHYLDIMLWAHIKSTRTFYRHVRETLGHLDESLPDTTLASDLHNPERLAALAAGFETRSHTWVKGCIGAVDGLLIPIVSPGNAAGDGAGKYFTRKGFYAWNMQGVCDADCRITYFSMRCVGSTHDSYAWSNDPLMKSMATGGEHYEKLKALGLHLVGDEAYTAGATLATPWSGRSCVGDDRDSRLAYNYYHSSARITIERTFGQLCRRFLILKRSYGGDLVQTDYAPGLLLILRCCVKLHNMGVDRGKYGKVMVHTPDMTGKPEQGERARQANHRGDLENLAAHTLLTSPNAWLLGEEANGNAFPTGLKYKTPDGVEHEPSLYDPEYLRQQSAGHRKSDDCATRQATTLHMKTMKIQRPTPVHWRA